VLLFCIDSSISLITYVLHNTVDVTKWITPMHVLPMVKELAFREWVNALLVPPPPRVSLRKHRVLDLPPPPPWLLLLRLVGRNVKLVHPQTRPWIAKLRASFASWIWVFAITNPVFMTASVWRFLRHVRQITILFGELLLNFPFMD
jgi:hypothetical protein